MRFPWMLLILLVLAYFAGARWPMIAQRVGVA
jgi:hypothetical protein